MARGNNPGDRGAPLAIGQPVPLNAQQNSAGDCPPFERSVYPPSAGDRLGDRAVNLSQ